MCCIFLMSYKKDMAGVSIELSICKSDMFLETKEKGGSCYERNVYHDYRI